MKRKTKALSIVIAGPLVLGLPTQALPSGDASEDIPITDPVLLERMGLEADATNIYATPPGSRKWKRRPPGSS